MEGELGQGQWTDWCERLATEDGLHSLPHVPSASQVDRTRSLDEDDAEKRRQMREWYNQHTDFDWSSWHVWDVGPSTLNSTAGVDDTVYASTSYDNGYYTELFSSDYGGDFSGPESHISDLESFSSYTLDDFEPAATRYLTDTPQGLSRRGGRPAAAFQEYTASDESEISFKVGDVVSVHSPVVVRCCHSHIFSIVQVMVTRLDSSGWWRGYVYGAEVRYVGWFPCTYISWLAPGRAALYTPDPTLDDSSSNDGFTSERGSTTSGDDYVIRGDSKRSDYGRFLPLLPEGLTPRDRHFRESATAQRLPLVVEEAEGEDEYDYDHEPADVEPRVISSYPARVSDTTFPDASGFVYDSDWMPASDAYDSYRSLVSDSEAAATHDAQLGLWKWNPSTDMWEMSRAGGVVVAEADPFTLSHDSSQLPVMATTTSAYAAADDQELALEVNDSVEVLEEDFSGWWRGRNTRTGQEGWFPCAYVAKME